MSEPTACDAALRQVSDLIAGELDGGDAAALDRHLAGCEACYQKSVQFLRQDRAFTQMAARARLPEASQRLRQELTKNNPVIFRRVLIASAAAAALLVAAFFVLQQKPTATMVVDLVSGEVMLDDIQVASGDAIRPGQSLETRGRGRASIRFADTTVVELAEKTLVRNIADAEGKRLTIARGSVSATVAPQMQGRPMIFESKSGAARVLGTSLRLVVDDELGQTRLEVTEGKVQLTRWADKKSVEVSAGHFAVAAAGVDLTARPLSKGKTPTDLFQLDYPSLRSVMQLKSKLWETLPWHVSLAEAREAAAREKKPVFIILTNGHPLGTVGMNGIIFRESVLSDPETVKLLTEKFVVLALDNSVHVDPDEQAWVDQHDFGFANSTFGIAVFAPDGKRLVAGTPFDPPQARYFLNLALRSFQPVTEPLQDIPRTSRSGLRRPPEGGAVLRVTWKAFYDQPDSTFVSPKREKLFQEALGSDRFWIRKDEVEALVEGRFPPSLNNRLLRFPVESCYSSGLKRMDMSLAQGRLVGTASSDDPSEDVSFQGIVESKDGKLVRFELLARGEAPRRDDGFRVSLAAAPKGKRSPTAMYFELVDPAEPINRIPPHSSSNSAYLR